MGTVPSSLVPRYAWDSPHFARSSESGSEGGPREVGGGGSGSGCRCGRFFPFDLLESEGVFAFALFEDPRDDAHFTDADYRSVGGEVVYSADEVWGRSDIILKVKLPSADELGCVRAGQVIAGFLHLPVSPHGILEKLIELELTTLSYEEVVDGDGRFPVVYPLSELCGRMLPQVASRYLQSDEGGRGVLLSGTAGVPSAEVVILGCGAVGMHAAQAFYGLGAHVTVLDRNFNVLQRLDELLMGKVNTLIASGYNIEKVLGYADVLIGAIHAPFRLAEHIVTREMIRKMRPRAVAIDVSIDQGGCFETSRPTTIFDPVFVEEGVIHYCVPNLTSLVARTASHSITNAVLPFMFEVIEKGGIRNATSIHVQFLTREMTFLFTWRINGQTIDHSAITSFKGAATFKKSPFNVLAART